MGLNFSQIPEQTNIFIDSNIFLYLFLKHPGYYQACRSFIQRIERGEIIGLINDFVYNEVMHKLMVTALVNHNHCSPHEAISFIKREPEVLDELPELWQAGELLQLIDLKKISGPFFPSALSFSKKYKLLITDAVHVAGMQKDGVFHIATNDNDFRHIPSLIIYKPEREDYIG